MIRLIVFLAILAGLALGLSWLADRPGELVLTWQGYRVETSVLVGLAAMAGVALAFVILWSFLRFLLRIPSVVAITARARRRNRGYGALTRGMIAAASGDTRYAARATREAEKLLGEEPMTLLLRAQTAQLSGDRHLTEQTFARMIERPETRLLGLRGLHAEARRRGDDETAHIYAEQAHRIAPVGWAGDALLDYHVVRQDWRRALDVVETNRTHKGVDKTTADRQRAVLLTAIARETAERDADGALKRAREAVKLAPDLVPASEIAGRILSRKGDLRRAARILEAAWRQSAHPDIAAAYLELRPGDSAGDRLVRAEALARIAPGHAETRLTLGRAALEARDFARARQTLHPLIAADASARPTLRTCLLMADLEEAEHGRDTGPVREWLARAARAPRDPVWIADGVLSDHWEPASPVTGKLDAFHWAAPTERLSAPQQWIPVEDDRPEIEADETPASAPAATILPPASPEPKDPAPAAEPAPDLEKAPEPEPPPPAPKPAAVAASAPAPTPEPAAAKPVATMSAMTTEAPPAPAPRRAAGSALYPMPSIPDDPGPEPADAGAGAGQRRFFP
jgi:HemY protein